MKKKELLERLWQVENKIKVQEGTIMLLISSVNAGAPNNIIRKKLTSAVEDDCYNIADELAKLESDIYTSDESE